MFALQDQDIPRAGARDLTRHGALARRLRRTAAGVACATAVALPLAGAATAQAATSAPHTLTNVWTSLAPQNGWFDYQNHTAAPAVTNIGGIVHLKGAIATLGSNPVPFTLPVGDRPANEVHVQVDLCNANSGRLNISPTGVVDVVAEGGNSSNADCGTSLDGAWFAPSETSFTQLTLQNGWHNYEDGTATAAVRKISGIVHLEGAIATSGSSQLVAFTLPVGFRPAHNVYVSVDMNNASKGHVLIDSNGQVTVFAEGNPSDATMFTSLDGVSFAP